MSTGGKPAARRAASTAMARAVRGVALVIVLWMLALLTVIAGSMVYSLRSDVQVAGNLAAAASAEAAADAGVFRAIRELARPITDVRRWQGNGLAHEWRFGDAALRIVIIGEAGKININAAPEILLAGMFRSLGADEEMAVSLADAIADWRDADDLRRPHGAEKEDYLAAGKDYPPKNGEFESIEELRLVLGITDEIFRRVVPLITVRSGRAGIDASVAPRAVLLALPGATPEEVDAFLEQRQARLAQGMPVVVPAFAQAWLAPPVADTFSIQVQAVLGDNTAFFREAVVQMAGNIRDPAVVLAWRSLPAGNEPPTSGAEQR
jgi:general secretion pathway protein K